MQHPPNAVDVLELEFKLKHRVRVFKNEDIGKFYNPTNAIVSSTKYGLLFISTPNCEINVIPFNAILELNVSGECRSFPYRVIDTPGIASHLNINCDDTLLSVTVRMRTSVDTLFYKLESFLTADVCLVQHINSTYSEDIYVLDSGWNPAIPNLYCICKSDGSLDIFTFETNGLVHKIQLSIESDSRCFCWSPRGKQIAVGSRNGSITQYKPDLSVVKVVAAPPATGPIVSLWWISSYQFVTVYSSLSTTENLLVVIDVIKADSIVYTNYDDICYSHGDIRSKQFYMHVLLEWNTLIVASSNSSEVGILGLVNNQWTQLILTDSARAELPLSSHSKQDTFPIGFVVDFTFKKNLLPYLLILSDEGLLCCYAIVCTRENAKSLCRRQKPPPYSDLLYKLYELSESPKLIMDPNLATLSNMDLHQSGELCTDINETVSIMSQSIQSGIGRDPHVPTNFQCLKTISKTSNKELLFPFSLVYKSDLYSHENNSQSKLKKLTCAKFCCLELELNTLLFKGGFIQLITDDDSVYVIKLENSTWTFVSEVTDSLGTQVAEIIILKQRVMQSWTCYEDVKSRLFIYANPTTTLMRFQPLYFTCQRQLEDLYFLLIYTESQLLHGNRNLDEEWALFQMSCKDTLALQLTSIEMIYRAIVKHDATLQKQVYILKDTRSRLLKQIALNILSSTKGIQSLENHSNEVILDSHNFEGERRRASRFYLSKAKKRRELRTLLESRKVTYLPNIKKFFLKFNSTIVETSKSESS